MQRSPSIRILRMDIRLLREQIRYDAQMPIQGSLVQRGLSHPHPHGASGTRPQSRNSSTQVAALSLTSPSLSSMSGIAPHSSTTVAPNRRTPSERVETRKKMQGNTHAISQCRATRGSRPRAAP